MRVILSILFPIDFSLAGVMMAVNSMAAKLVISNQDRYDEYILLIDGADSAEVFPLSTITTEIAPGVHTISFRSKAATEIPLTCKPIRVTLKDGATLSLQVRTQNLVIRIYDTQECQLNAKQGFLCGRVADGVHVENPIE